MPTSPLAQMLPSEDMVLVVPNEDIDRCVTLYADGSSAAWCPLRASDSCLGVRCSLGSVRLESVGVSRPEPLLGAS
jgi:hypothetical protein